MQPHSRSCHGTCCGRISRAVGGSGYVTVRVCSRSPVLAPRGCCPRGDAGSRPWVGARQMGHWAGFGRSVLPTPSPPGQVSAVTTAVRSICCPCPATRSPNAPRYLAPAVITGARCCEEPGALIRPLITKRWVFCSARNASLPPALWAAASICSFSECLH